MFAILSVSLLCGLIYMYLNPCHSEYNIYRSKNEGSYVVGLVFALICAFAIRIAGAMMFEGHETDIVCFKGWADMVYNDGFRAFYKSDAFTDYPPGYMYVLYIVGWLRTIVGDSSVFVKLPAIIADVVLGVCVYVFARKRFSEKTVLILSGFLLFSPVLILNSALWGQVDVIYTLLVALNLLCVSRKNMVLSYFLFALAFFVKPQALIFTPVLLCGIWENVIKDCTSKKLLINLVSGLCAIGMVVLLSVPFGLKETFSQYIGTLASYPYATVNAFNVYGAFGLNWAPLTTDISVMGWIGIAVVTAYVFFEYFSGNKNWFMLAGVLAFGTYMLSAKMHERYAFPAVVFFLLAFVLKPQKKNMWLFILTSLSQFVNAAWVLFVYSKDINHYFKSPVVVCFSIINILLFAYMIYACRKSVSDNAVEACEENGKLHIFKSEKLGSLTKKDYLLMLLLTVIYGAISFYNLGEMKAPETFYDLAQAPVTVSFDEPRQIQKIALYPSCNDIYDERSITVSYTEENGVQSEIVLDDQEVFCWNYIDFGKTVTDITFSTKSERLMVMEIGLLGTDGLVGAGDGALFDEQELVPDRKTHLNSTYFDEIYHARTGYEFVNGYKVYEWTHPPLGKVLIAVGIKLFGMNPFGWRVVGNLFGIFMVPVFYIMAKRMFKKTWISFLGTVLFTFDFMHFAQTRISTIDVYVTFFIMLMYLFMYRYFQTSFYDTPLKKTFLPLALAGVTFGLGAASKWTAFYACAGIALIYFGVLAVRYNEYYNIRKITGEKLPFRECFIKSCLFCVIVFIIIPCIIYLLSYIPYLKTEGADGIKTIIDNQRDIFIYHSKTVVQSEHPFASRWYTWPIMKRPIWYYSGEISENIKEGISSFGNPAVWWTGAVAVLYNMYLAFVNRDRKAAYLLVAYFSCLLPWIPVARTTYIYHYFPCVPFATLMIANGADSIAKKFPRSAFAALTVVAISAVMLFIMFYPVLSGQGVSPEFVHKFLAWFETWVLI